MSAVMTSWKYIDSKIEKYLGRSRKKMEKKEGRRMKRCFEYESSHLFPEQVILIIVIFRIC